MKFAQWILVRLRGDRDGLPTVAFACCAVGAGTWFPACPAGLSIRSANAKDGSGAGILKTFWVLTGACPYRRSGGARERDRRSRFFTLIVLKQASK